jgi:hypothetical protein
LARIAVYAAVWGLAAASNCASSVFFEVDCVTVLSLSIVVAYRFQVRSLVAALIGTAILGPLFFTSHFLVVFGQAPPLGTFALVAVCWFCSACLGYMTAQMVEAIAVHVTANVKARMRNVKD